jgi:5,10-methylenetetrahydromethanopterin reductase
VPIRHIMPDHGFVRFDPAIPLYVSGFGPRSLGLAGKHGDGAVMPFPPAPSVLEAFWSSIEAGAAEAGRTLAREQFRTTALTTITVLDAGEPTDSARARAECGPFALATLHYAYDQWRQLGKPPPAFVAPVWDEYTALLATVPEERLHQRIHSGHNCWVIPEEERFVTRELIETSCLVGTADAIAARLRALGEAGLDEVILLPAWEPRYEVLERVARDVLPALAAV